MKPKLKYVKSPLNYMGGKFKQLDSLLENFPENVDCFVDLFGGGFNVGINVDANKIIYNDQIKYLVDLFNYFKNNNISNILSSIDSIISEYELSKENNLGYNRLRIDYNKTKDILKLLVLIFFSFNHQIRFNNNHEFNTPFGKNRSSYNSSIKSNLIDFIEVIKEKNVEFINGNFTDFPFEELSSDDFVYCDPPYLITNGSYNDGNRGFKDWTEAEEVALLNVLDELNNRGIKFALSNVFLHNGLENTKLTEWSKKYNVIKLDNVNYNNSNYQSKSKDYLTLEVIVKNY